MPFNTAKCLFIIVVWQSINAVLEKVQWITSLMLLSQLLPPHTHASIQASDEPACRIEAKI